MSHSNEKKAKGNFWRRALGVLFLIPAWFAPHSRLRILFHRLRGIKIGKGCEIGYFVIMGNVHPEMIIIEDGAVITDTYEFDKEVESVTERFISLAEPELKESGLVKIGGSIMEYDSEIFDISFGKEPASELKRIDLYYIDLKVKDPQICFKVSVKIR